MKYQQKDVVYQIDCSCYSGGSGGPVVNKKGELVGVLFQNLTFQTNKESLQLPQAGFIISKEIINLIINQIDNQTDKILSQKIFENLWIFKITNEEVDKYLSFNSFKAKF